MPPIGSWVALHRVREVRKLLLVSQSSEKKHFLLSANYSGEFNK